VTAINAEVALAEGVLMLERYARGANAANATIPRGAPTLVILRPTSDTYAGLHPAFTVAAYLPPLPPPPPPPVAGGGKAGGRAGGRAGGGGGAPAPSPLLAAAFPAPTDPGVALAARPAALTFALPFGGFARGGVALSNAARLALALTRARIPFQVGGAFGLALYDPPTRWAGRHNEVWVWGAGGEWSGGGEEGGVGRGRSSGGDGRPVATHL
jgi:hypothetical protein